MSPVRYAGRASFLAEWKLESVPRAGSDRHSMARKAEIKLTYQQVDMDGMVVGSGVFKKA
jgi:hypothetical protein